MVTKPDFEDFVFYISLGDCNASKVSLFVRYDCNSPTQPGFSVLMLKFRGSSQGNPYCTNH